LRSNFDLIFLTHSGVARTAEGGMVYQNSTSVMRYATKKTAKCYQI